MARSFPKINCGFGKSGDQQDVVPRNILPRINICYKNLTPNATKIEPAPGCSLLEEVNEIVFPDRGERPGGVARIFRLRDPPATVNRYGHSYAGVAELADALDSKSSIRKNVSVRSRPPVGL